MPVGVGRDYFGESLEMFAGSENDIQFITQRMWLAV